MAPHTCFRTGQQYQIPNILILILQRQCGNDCECFINNVDLLTAGEYLNRLNTDKLWKTSFYYETAFKTRKRHLTRSQISDHRCSHIIISIYDSFFIFPGTTLISLSIESQFTLEWLQWLHMKSFISLDSKTLIDLNQKWAKWSHPGFHLKNHNHTSCFLCLRVCPPPPSPPLPSLLSPRPLHFFH